MANKEKPSEGMYTRAELTAAAKVAFEESPDIVAAALKYKGLEQATIEEAKAAIKKFKEMEV